MTGAEIAATLVGSHSEKEGAAGTYKGGYHDLGGDYFARRDPQRATRRLVAQLERLGHTVTLQEAVA